jgi:hypothetical protein
MRTLVLFLFSYLALNAGQHVPKVWTIIVAAGQSNCVGELEATETTDWAERGLDTRILYTVKADSFSVVNTPQALRGYRDDPVGPDRVFVRLYQIGHPDENVLLVKYAISGSNLHTQWAADTGTHYQGLIAQIEYATDWLTDRGWRWEFQDFVWVQGESDANASGADDYASNFIAMLGALESDIGQSFRNVLVARLSPFEEGTNADWVTVQNQQDTLPALDARIRVIDTDTLERRPGDGIHFTGSGGEELGSLLHNAAY